MDGLRTRRRQGTQREAYLQGAGRRGCACPTPDLGAQRTPERRLPRLAPLPGSPKPARRPEHRALRAERCPG